jgi:hypothetical protein
MYVIQLGRYIYISWKAYQLPHTYIRKSRIWKVQAKVASTKVELYELYSSNSSICQTICVKTMNYKYVVFLIQSVSQVLTEYCNASNSLYSSSHILDVCHIY